MEIYKIENDGFRYQELDLEIVDFQDQVPGEISTLELYQFSENNMALAEYWPSMKTGFSEIEGGENLLPDITGWIGATLVLSPKAHRYLKELLNPFGEFLPIIVDKETYQIFNCLTEVTATRKKSNEVEFKSLEIHGKAAFKAPREFESNVYCTQQLKSAIEAFELKGIIFSKT